jgi:hypothetical protein
MAELDDCMESKIPKIMAEGKDRTQAVAMARSMCEEDTEKKSLSDLKLELHRKFNAMLDEIDAAEVTETDDQQDGDKAWRPSQNEVNYTPLTPDQTRLCGGCRWFNSHYEAEQNGACHLIDNWPLEVVSTGYCDRWEAIPVFEPTQTPMEVVIVDDLTDKEHHDHAADQRIVYAAPDSNQESILKAIVDKIRRGIRPGQMVMKVADGQRLMLIVTSNSYQDREGETLKTQALKEDVDRHWTGDDATFMTNNPLLYWHDDDIVLGDIVWADMIGPFYTELARESASPVSKHYFDWREQHPDEKWGASHRFAYFRNHRTSGGDFNRIFKRETSTLPLKDAANVGTLSEVIPMSSNRSKKFDEIMGLDGAHDILKTEGLDALVKRLQAAGVEHKALDAEPPADAFAKLVVDMADDLASLDERVEKAVGELAAQQKAYADKNTELADSVKAVNELIGRLNERIEAAPRRASQDSSTVIEKNELSKEVADLMMVKDPVFGMIHPPKGT